MGGLDWRVFCGVYGGDYGVCGGVAAGFRVWCFFAVGVRRAMAGILRGVVRALLRVIGGAKIFGKEKAKKVCSRCF